MKYITIALALLTFLIGFYGVALFNKTSEYFVINSYIFFVGVIIATILILIDDKIEKK